MTKGLIGEIDFYRARAIDMMKKAQLSHSEITRQIYMDLAQKWTEQADSLEKSAHDKPTPDQSPDPGGPAPSSSQK